MDRSCRSTIVFKLDLRRKSRLDGRSLSWVTSLEKFRHFLCCLYRSFTVFISLIIALSSPPRRRSLFFGRSRRILSRATINFPTPYPVALLCQARVCTGVYHSFEIVLISSIASSLQSSEATRRPLFNSLEAFAVAPSFRRLVPCFFPTLPPPCRCEILIPRIAINSTHCFRPFHFLPRFSRIERALARVLQTEREKVRSTKKLGDRLPR